MRQQRQQRQAVHEQNTADTALQVTVSSSWERVTWGHILRGADARVAALSLLKYFGNSKVCQFDHMQHLVATQVSPEQYVCTNHRSAVVEVLGAAGGAEQSEVEHSTVQQSRAQQSTAQQSTAEYSTVCAQHSMSSATYWLA